MKTILVTGGTGFIGRQAIPILLERGYDVHLVTHAALPTDTAESSVHYHHCDLFDPQQQTALFDQVRPSHLMHFAWYTVPKEYWESNLNLNWVSCSLRLLDNLAKRGGRRAVFAGSCAEYDWSVGNSVETLSPKTPSSFYGICKNALREVFERYCEQNHLQGAWGRIFFPYGPHEHPAKLIPSTIQALLQGKRAFCQNGALLRDYLYVSDVAAAFVSILESEFSGVVNIGSGRAVALRDIISTIASQMGYPDRVDYGSETSSDGQAPVLVADVQTLTEEIGFVPKVKLVDGLYSTIEWWRSRLSVDADAR